MKILKCKSDRLKVRPGIFDLRNSFYLYEDGDNGNLISVSLSFEKFFGRGGATMVCADGKTFNFHLDLEPKKKLLKLDSNWTNQIEFEILLWFDQYFCFIT